MSWYYAENNERRGPIEEAAFQTLVSTGTITPDTLVWREGFTDWIPYAKATPATSAASPVLTAAASPLETTGATVSSAAACSQCGRLFPADDMVSYENRYVCADCKPAFFQKIKEGASIVGQQEFAGFWIRFGAKFLDGIIMNIASQIVQLIIGLGLRSSPEAAAIIGALVALVLNAGYVIYFTGKYGATPGKMACKIEVIRTDGSPLTFGRATGRYFAEILSSLTLFIGYIMAAFDEEKRALHDRICDTRVVRKRQ
jgi:uncharacterized RDD family membrane protein YckC